MYLKSSASFQSNLNECVVTAHRLIRQDPDLQRTLSDAKRNLLLPECARSLHTSQGSSRNVRDHVGAEALHQHKRNASDEAGEERHLGFSKSSKPTVKSSLTITRQPLHASYLGWRCKTRCKSLLRHIQQPTTAVRRQWLVVCMWHTSVCV